MLTMLTMRTAVGLAAVTVMKFPKVAAFVRPTAIRSTLRHASRGQAYSSSSVSLQLTLNEQLLLL